MTGRARILPVTAAALAAAGAVASVALGTAQRGAVPAGEAVIALVVCTYAGVGLLIALARPGHLVGRVLLGGATAWGVGEGALALAVADLAATGPGIAPGTVPGAPWLAMVGTTLRGGGWLVLVLVVPLVFPDGRLPRRPWRWAAGVTAAALTCFVATSLLAPAPTDERLAEVPNPLAPPASVAGLTDVLAALSLAFTAAALVGAVAGLVGRWRDGSALVRQQLLWLAWAAAVPALLLPFILFGDPGAVLFGAAVLPLPVAIATAVLQHRLYDVQVVVNRTFLSVTLSAALAAVYVLVVAGVGALLGARGARWLPWLATGAVALSVLPLRDALQRAANRVTYGRWSQPEAVLADVRRRLADATDVDGLLHELVRELGEGLELGRIAVVDDAGATLAEHGSGTGPEDQTPLTAYGRPVGLLRWTDPRRPLRDGDRQLLDDIAAHLGALVHASQLVSGLRRANERLVRAREDERQRLRRDLHDGLGSRLTGLTFQVEAVRRGLRKDVEAAERALGRIRAGVQEAVADVRRAVEELRPPDLEQFGLAGALTALGERLAPALPGGIAVESPPDLSALPPAVETAAYRIAQEAMTNAVRHAGASSCRVSIRAEPSRLLVEVQDDGSGLVAPRPGGTGLDGMRERAEMLSGDLEVDARPGLGTAVRARLPLPAPDPSRTDAPMAGQGAR